MKLIIIFISIKNTEDGDNDKQLYITHDTYFKQRSDDSIAKQALQWTTQGRQRKTLTGNTWKRDL